MEYPETLTAALLLEHEGHGLTVHRHGRHSFPAGFTTAAASIECQTCGEGVALEWTEGDK
jgi:hypothetical protein